MKNNGEGDLVNFLVNEKKFTMVIELSGSIDIFEN